MAYEKKMLPREAGREGVYLYSEKYGVPVAGAYVDYFQPGTGDKRQAVVDEVIPAGTLPSMKYGTICLVDDETGAEVEMELRADPRVG